MIYLNGCAACRQYIKLIKQYELENVIEPIEFGMYDMLGEDLKKAFLSQPQSSKIAFPMFILHNDDKMKAVSRTLLSETIKNIYGENVLPGLI